MSGIQPGFLSVPRPVTLQGAHVRMEPMSLSHHAALCEVALEPELWRFGLSKLTTPDDLRAYMETALREQEEGRSLPFVTVEHASGRPIGSTRFGNMDSTNRRVEIGWTWIGVPWQRTAANTEAKLLMLTHAFETLGCVRVELKTSSKNEKSKNAMRRMGAKEEGTFRNHMIQADGGLRHSVFFSVICEEWPEVKARLKGFLAARR